MPRHSEPIGSFFGAQAALTESGAHFVPLKISDLKYLKSQISKGGFGGRMSLRYILRRHNAEGSHNGSAAVLKTADRKVMQVRVLSPPPLL